MDEPNKSLAREKLLDVAERLFSQRGYASVTLRDIAQALDIKQPSLYYHVKGKEELFVEVTERNLQRHREGLGKVMHDNAPRWQDQLHAVGDWMLSQPPMNIARVIQSDMPEISKGNADHLMQSVYQSMFMPLEQIFVQAQAQTPIPLPPAGIMAGTFLTLLESVHNIPMSFQMTNKMQSAHQIIDVLIRGLEAR